ncbi:MAG: hypothetical protein KAS53_11550 [Candidatus Cloacimonetes bacterium]|nr:hypothetical protein [Candidatus Cloacimonadota bacterium]
MYIPKYHFSFDKFIENNLNDENISIPKMIDACYKEIDRIDRIPKNKMHKDEWDSLVNYHTLLNGLPYFLRNGVTSNGEEIEQKYRKIQNSLSKKSK